MWYRFRLRGTTGPWAYLDSRSQMLAKRLAARVLGRLSFSFERVKEPPSGLKQHRAKIVVSYYTEKSL